MVASTHPRMQAGELMPEDLIGHAGAHLPATFGEPVKGLTIARSPALVAAGG